MNANHSLTPGDYINSGSIAVRRRLTAIRHKRGTHKRISRIPQIDMDLQSCLAECLVSKATGLRWNNDYHTDPKNESFGDVGNGVEVRHTTRPNGCLIITPHDFEDRPYFLVVGQDLDMQIVGWKMGSDCKLPKYFRDCSEQYGEKANGYFVPQSDLDPVYTFDPSRYL